MYQTQAKQLYQMWAKKFNKPRAIKLSKLRAIKLNKLRAKQLAWAKILDKTWAKKLKREQKEIYSLVSTIYDQNIQNQDKWPLHFGKFSGMTQQIRRTPLVNQPSYTSSKQPDQDTMTVITSPLGVWIVVLMF